MSLPTYRNLGAVPPKDIDAHIVVTNWLVSFADALASNDIPAITALFIEDGYWRDLLAMTWDYRSFHGRERIAQFLKDRLATSQLSAFMLSDVTAPKLMAPYPDLSWIQAMLTFETAAGTGYAVVRLVYHSSGEWKAFTLATTLDKLRGGELDIDFEYPECENRAADDYAEELSVQEDPTVLIVGAGQSGLGLAARLKMLGVTSMIVEKNDRVGDNWRQARYSSLRVHDPMWRDQLPLFSMPEPPLWPVFTPGKKLGDWFEAYANLLDLNVATSSTIQDPKFDPSTKEWTVRIARSDGTSRTLKTKHVVWCTGLTGGRPVMPKFEGMADFQGKIIHGADFRDYKEFKGKKVVVIGSGISGHDICRDLALAKVDVTMVQRGSTYVMTVKNTVPLQWKQLYWKGSPPTEIADILYLSVPHKVSMPMSVRFTAKAAELDQELLDGLERVGFKTNMGIDGTGWFRLSLERFGGSHMDAGASEMIIDGRIKLKSDALIHSFTPEGVKFTDECVLPADAVICATGYGHMHDSIEEAFGKSLRSVLKEKFWDFDGEGEVNGIWRDSGHERFYVAYGNFPTARYFSKLLALQIKAIEMGVLDSRYSLE